jgi:hypothetical protein
MSVYLEWAKGLRGCPGELKFVSLFVAIAVEIWPGVEGVVFAAD